MIVQYRPVLGKTRRIGSFPRPCLIRHAGDVAWLVSATSRVFRHRCTVRTVTRKLAAISAVPSPASKRPAVSSRSRSRRSRSPAVSPPPDAYLIGEALPQSPRP